MIASVQKGFSVLPLPLFSSRLEQLMYEKPFNIKAFWNGQLQAKIKRGQQRVGHIKRT